MDIVVQSHAFVAISETRISTFSTGKHAPDSPGPFFFSKPATLDLKSQKMIWEKSAYQDLCKPCREIRHNVSVKQQTKGKVLRLNSLLVYATLNSIFSEMAYFLSLENIVLIPSFKGSSQTVPHACTHNIHRTGVVTHFIYLSRNVT